MTKAIIGLSLAILLGTAGLGCTKEQHASKSNPTLPATRPASEVATTEAGLNPLFTLPPSKGPAAHQFQQITLLRSGPSGDLEMQLTGDGIYRIRDHGRGKSYSGDGKLTDAQISEWANLMKNWESLKETYIVAGTPTDGDKIEIIYGGKKVVVNSAAKDNPKEFVEAYQRLLALAAESQK